MDLGLRDRVAIVTGSSRGIGRSTAELFAREGARVVVTYCRNRDAAEDTAARLARCTETMVLRWNLASDDSIRDATDAVLERWNRIDVLVNNAVAWGLRTPSTMPPFERLAPAEWRDGLRHNIEGTYFSTQAVLPAMRQARWGRIVNVSATAADDGLPGNAWYTAAKSAMHGLTRTLAKEAGPDGILVNVVMPGLTLTEGTARHVPAEVHERVARTAPVRRVLEGSDIASTIVFLCSTANTAVTGEIIRASGGYRM